MSVPAVIEEVKIAKEERNVSESPEHFQKIMSVLHSAKPDSLLALEAFLQQHYGSHIKKFSSSRFLLLVLKFGTSKDLVLLLSIENGKILADKNKCELYLTSAIYIEKFDCISLLIEHYCKTEDSSNKLNVVRMLMRSNKIQLLALTLEKFPLLFYSNIRFPGIEENNILFLLMNDLRISPLPVLVDNDGEPIYYAVPVYDRALLDRIKATAPMLQFLIEHAENKQLLPPDVIAHARHSLSARRIAIWERKGKIRSILHEIAHKTYDAEEFSYGGELSSEPTFVRTLQQDTRLKTLKIETYESLCEDLTAIFQKNTTIETLEINAFKPKCYPNQKLLGLLKSLHSASVKSLTLRDVSEFPGITLDAELIQAIMTNKNLKILNIVSGSVCFMTTELIKTLQQNQSLVDVRLNTNRCRTPQNPAHIHDVVMSNLENAIKETTTRNKIAPVIEIFDFWQELLKDKDYDKKSVLR